MTKLAVFIFSSGLILTGCLGGFNQARQQTPNPSVMPVARARAIIMLDFGEGETASYSATLTDGKTVYDLLVQASEVLNYPLDTQQFDFGVLVKRIGSRQSTSNQAWLYFVNGSAGQVAADQAEVKPGDVIEWRYTKLE